MHAAKVKAAREGESLKDLFTRAIAHEVRQTGQRRAAGRVSFPLIRSHDGPKVDITNADIEDALATDDVERYGR